MLTGGCQRRHSQAIHVINGSWSRSEKSGSRSLGTTRSSSAHAFDWTSGCRTMASMKVRRVDRVCAIKIVTFLGRTSVHTVHTYCIGAGCVRRSDNVLDNRLSLICTTFLRSFPKQRFKLDRHERRLSTSLFLDQNCESMRIKRMDGAPGSVSQSRKHS